MTKKIYQAAVLGSPIAHSRSPQMHRAVYQYLKAPIEYGRIEVAEDQAESFMANLQQRFGSTESLAGFSVTMPLKNKLVPYMTTVSQRVQHLGVLNTVVFDTEGAAHGYNTDVDGVIGALNQAGYQSTKDGGHSMGVLGAGGTASAAVAAAADLGMSSITLYVRNAQRAQATVEVAQAFDLAIQVKNLSDFASSAVTHDSVVATLPAHAADTLALQLPAHGLPPLLDVIYDPWPTQLATRWQATGASVASGLDMLLYQGIEQAKLFTAKMLEGHDHIDWGIARQYMAEALGIDHK